MSAPDPDEIKNQYYKNSEKCYQYETYVTKCPKDKASVVGSDPA